MIVEVLDAASGGDAGAVERRVRERVHALCARFPIYRDAA
jgi:hypothetical protein